MGGKVLLIEFKHVFKKYANQVVAVNDFNIKIQQGEFVYVIGPSGAGEIDFYQNDVSGRKTDIWAD